MELMSWYPPFCCCLSVKYTPMILADAFNRSQSARDNDFTTCDLDGPLVVQFGANDPIEFAKAAEKIISQPNVKGVDLNCGCPQKWAMSEGIGAALSAKPDLVKEMVTAAKQMLLQKENDTKRLLVSIKIRLHRDLHITKELIQRAVHAGVDFIVLHGRTASERREPPHYDQIKLMREICEVPMIANGNVFSYYDAVGSFIYYYSE